MNTLLCLLFITALSVTVTTASNGSGRSTSPAAPAEAAEAAEAAAAAKLSESAVISVPVPDGMYTWLFNKTVDMLKRCQLTGVGGVQLLTPDASSSYGAQWTRDFTMAVASAPAALKATKVNVSAAIAYTLDRITADGMVPDRCQSDGRAVFAPGGPGSWPILLAWDNMPYAGLLLAAYANSWTDTDGLGAVSAFFCKYEPVVRRALDFVPLSRGLAFNDAAKPNCSFGFEDSVVLPGRMLTVSLLLHDAASQLAQLTQTMGCGDSAHYAALAKGVASNVDDLFDATGDSGLFLASDTLETVPDVFGSAYLVTLGLSTASRRLSVAKFLHDQWVASPLNLSGARNVDGVADEGNSRASVPIASAVTKAKLSKKGAPAEAKLDPAAAAAAEAAAAAAAAAEEEEEEATVAINLRDEVTTTIWQEGQARHLPYPLAWKQCWNNACPREGTYQNGAFWATPLNWLVPAMAANGYASDAANVAAAAINSFQTKGVMEAINRDIGYTGVGDYVASACNVLAVVSPE